MAMHVVCSLIVTCLVSASQVRAGADYSTAKNVKVITSAADFNKAINVDRPVLVQFFAPWCGHCTQFESTFKQLAAQIPVDVLAVDGDANKDISGREGIQGFPTVRLYLNGKPLGGNYQGDRSKAAKIAEWVVDTLTKETRKRFGLGAGSSSGGSSGSSSGGSGVVILTDANFASKTKSGVWLVEFFAPWCGHCKQLEPVYKKLAEKVHAENKDDESGEVFIASVDATVEQSTAQSHGIRGFPTIKLFVDGKEVEDYNGGRDLDSLLAFVKSKRPVKKTPSEVRELLDEAKDLRESCLEKAPLCVLAFLPHLLDCDAKCRKAYIKLLEKEAAEGIADGRGWVFLWTEGAKHVTSLEEPLGLGPGIGYPSLAVLNGKRQRFAPLRGSFGKQGISDFLRAVVYGKQAVLPLPQLAGGLQLNRDEPLTKWDGKDFPQEPEEAGDATTDDKEEL